MVSYRFMGVANSQAEGEAVCREAQNGRRRNWSEALYFWLGSALSLFCTCSRAMICHPGSIWFGCVSKWIGVRVLCEYMFALLKLEWMLIRTDSSDVSLLFSLNTYCCLSAWLSVPHKSGKLDYPSLQCLKYFKMGVRLLKAKSIGGCAFHCLWEECVCLWSDRPISPPRGQGGEQVA